MKTMPSKVLIGIPRLKLEDIYNVSFNGAKVDIHPSAVNKINKASRFLSKQVLAEKTIYGVNTGFGLLSNVKISDQKIEELQYRLLRSHATGVGELLGEEEVRAMLLLRAHNLALGHSGVRIELIKKILELLNKNILPCVPSQGSVGASGDLAPLAHLALPLIGEGKILISGKRLDTATYFNKNKIKKIKLGAKEGLALINGTQFMSAVGVINLLRAEKLSEYADVISAFSLEALRGTIKAFDLDIQKVRPHPGQKKVATNILKYLNHTAPSSIAKSHKNCDKVQDPYSLRCIPQVHGASRDCLGFVRKVLETEVNSVTDNPLVFPDKNKIISGGNFHGQIVSMSMDLLSIAVAELASISEQRIEKLVNPVISELPAFLIQDSGLNSGFMIVQVAAASLVSENKTLCHPASVDSIPTSADKEDHVSMGAWAAMKAKKVLDNSTRVLAMEWIAGAQGIDLLRPLKTTLFLEKVHKEIRKDVSFMKEDCSLSDSIELLAKKMMLNQIQSLKDLN